MKIYQVESYEALSQAACTHLIEEIKRNPQATICLATGSSPKRLYELFVEAVNNKNIDISQTTFVKLDEWHGPLPTHICTCEYFIQTNLLEKLKYQPKAYLSFLSNTENVEEEVKRIQNFINEQGIDIMILGLGMNGHLGLNEPSDSLTLDCHYAPLDAKTKTHSMIESFSIEGGLTIGLDGVFKAKQIIMLACGENKESAYEALLSKQITTQTPATLLWLHQNCDCFIDESQFK